MPFSITKSSLLSRIERAKVGTSGIRKIASGLRFSDASDGNGGILKFFRPATRLVGWLISAVFGIVSISITAIFNWLIQAANVIYRFNWNLSDADINRLVNQNFTAMSAVWGGVVGQSLGWFTGIAIGSGISYLLPVIGGATLARAVAGKASKEALTEIAYVLRGAVRQTASSLGANALLLGYMQIRRLIKRAPLDLLKSVFGDSADFIKNQWGNDGGPNMSLANQVDERIESIQNPMVRAFIENAYDEFWDGFLEAGFIIAAEFDTAYAQARTANQKDIKRKVFVSPDESVAGETFYLEGSESLVKEQTYQVLNAHRLIYNRDVGMIVGQPADDWYRAKPQRRKLTVIFKDLALPPWRKPDGSRPREAQYSIPDPVYGLTWERLKLATRSYLWGPFRCTANLDNGRQMAVYGGTAQAAEAKLRELLSLSTANIVTMSITEEKDRHPAVKKFPTQMYPAYATMLVKTPSVSLTGRSDLSGQRFDDDKLRAELWRAEPPDLFSLYF